MTGSNSLWDDFRDICESEPRGTDSMTTIIDRPDLLLTVEREGDIVRITAQMPMIGQTVTIGLDEVEADDLASVIERELDEIRGN